MRRLAQSTLIMVAISALAACSPDKKLVGIWTTHKGDCRGEGEVVIEVYDKTARVDFLCFAKTCARFKGKIDQAGYLRFSLPKGQSFDGQITGNLARGTWILELEEGYCQGSFSAGPIEKS